MADGCHSVTSEALTTKDKLMTDRVEVILNLSKDIFEESKKRNSFDDMVATKTEEECVVRAIEIYKRIQKELGP